MVFIQKIVVCFLQQIKIILAKGAFIMACNKIITIGAAEEKLDRNLLKNLVFRFMIRNF